MLSDFTPPSEAGPEPDHCVCFETKVARFERELRALAGADCGIEYFPSPAQHYRARIEFSLRRTGREAGAAQGGTRFCYVMFDGAGAVAKGPRGEKSVGAGNRKTGGEKRLRRFEYSDIPLQAISERMGPLLRYLERDSGAAEQTLSHRLFQVNWRADLDGQVLLSLLYHGRFAPHNLLDGSGDCSGGPANPPANRKNEQEAGEEHAAGAKDADLWRAGAERLRQGLGLSSVIGRSKSRLLHVGPPYLDSRVSLQDHRGSCLDLRMRQNDTCFSQPNAYSNREMLGWARRNFRSNLQGGKGEQSDLLELYCGIGNFTCALAPGFRRVLATEVVRQSVQLCRHNLAQNGLDNVAVARLSAAETAQALAGLRPFRRLRGMDLSQYRLRHLLLDPPRSGLDQQSREFALNFEQILYISCNPAKLLQDLAFWQVAGYRIQACAAFDQFPRTRHWEVAVVLRRRSIRPCFG